LFEGPKSYARGAATKDAPKRVKSLILQGFCPPRGVVKKPFSGYNMSYFLHAVFRTGKRSRDSRKFQLSGENVRAVGRVRQGILAS
jgi:hypothetical protein